MKDKLECKKVRYLLIFTAPCRICTVLWGECFSFIDGPWGQQYILSMRNHFKINSGFDYAPNF
jgi:hypothetical protein